MNNAPPSVGTISFGDVAPVTRMTAPESELKHYITDDELDKIANMKGGHAKEIFWSSLGLFLGALIPACESLIRFNAPNNPMGALGLLECGIALVGLAIACTSGYFWWDRAKGKKDIVQEIRDRPKLQVVN